MLVACYNLGAISSIPFVSIVSDHLGRRKSIVLGSTIMIIGAVMQGLSQNREYLQHAYCIQRFLQLTHMQSQCLSSVEFSLAMVLSMQLSPAPLFSAN